MRTKLIIAPLAMWLLVGCGTDGLFDRSLDVRGTVELGFGVAFLEGDPGRVLYLEVGAERTTVRELIEAAEGERLEWIAGGPDPASPQRLFLLGGPEDERTSEVGETLIAIDPAAETIRRYAVGSPFDGLAFDPSGRHAVLYHRSAADGTGLYNPNEVAVIDLDAEDSAAAVRVVSIGIGGRTIEGITFTPALEIAGVTRQLVVFMADGLIKLVDLLGEDIGTVSIKLVTDDDPREVVPVQVLARDADASHDPFLFVRASGSADVYAISLVPRTDGQAGFWASLNQFEGGPSPSDMHLIDDGAAPLLLVTSEQSDVATVVDVDTSADFKLELDGWASQALLRNGAAGPELVLYGTGTSWVSFLALEGLAEEQDANLESMQLPEVVSRVLVLDQDRLLMTPSYEDGLLLLDLRDREVTRLTASGGYEWEQAEMFGEVFFLAEPGDDRVVSMDLATGHPEPLVLDEPVSTFHLFPASGMGLVIHPAATGRATVFPLATPTRDFAEVVDGFWLDGFLDDTEVQ